MMHRRLNVRFLIKVTAIVAIVGIAVHFLHAFQVRRNADAFLDLARQCLKESLDLAEPSLKEKKVDQALVYFQHYLSIRPEDASARAGYALTLNERVRTTADRQRVVREMERVLAEDPGQAQVRYQLLLNLKELGRIDDALKQVNKLVAEAKSHPGREDWSRPANLEHILGWCLEATKKYAAAAEAFARAVEHDPARINSYELWAEVLLRLPPENEDDPEGRLREARAVMDRMVAANGKNFVAYLARSRFLKDQGAPAEAKADLDRAAKLAPERPAVVLALADWHIAQGDLKAARLLVEESRKAHPKNPALVKTLAAIHIRGGERVPAIDLLRQALAELPRATDLVVLFIELLLDEGALEEAQDRLAFLRSSGDAPLLSEYLKGRVAVEKKDWSEALALLERVRQELIPRSPWQGRLNALLGLCYRQVGDVAHEIAAFRRALEHEPGWREARLGLAGALARSGRLEEALPFLRELRAEGDEDKRRLPGLDVLFAQTLLAHTLRQNEKARDWAAVEDALAQAEKHDATSLALPLLKAELLTARGSPAKAEAVLAAARVAHPKEAAYWSLAAELALREGEFARALSLLAEAEKAAGPLPEISLARLHVWARNGAPEAAAQVEAFRRAIASWPVPARSRFLRALAETLAALGELKLAESAWRELAGLEPRDLSSRAALFDRALETGRIAEARRWLDELHDLEGDQGKWWRSGTAALLIQDGKKSPDKLGQARKILDKLAPQERDWPRLPLLRARLEEAAGNVDAALGHRLEALRLGEVEINSVRALLADLTARKRFLEADNVIVLLEERMALSPELARLGTEVALALPSPPKVRLRALTPYHLESTDYRILTWLTGVCHALGEEDLAETMARKAVALHPQTPDTWIALVRQLARSGKRDEAEKLIEEAAAKVSPPVVRSTLARCYEALGDLEKAELAYREGIKEQPRDFVLQTQAAEFFERTDQPAKATPILEGLLKTDADTPRDWLPRLRRQLALALAESGAETKALALLDLNGKPGKESPANQRARALVFGANPVVYAKTVKLFEEAVKAGPPADDDFYALARIHEKAGRAADAADLLLKLVLYQPENPRYLARLCLVLAGLDRLVEARSFLDRLERLEPASARTLAAKKAVGEG